MQTHIYIWKSSQEHEFSRFLMKIGMAIALGLLAIVFALGAYTGDGVSAHTLSVSCSRGDRAYTVVRGDTLGKIASRYRTSWSRIAAHNRLARPNLIYSGQVICIPGTSSAFRSGSKHAAPVHKSPVLVGRSSAPVGYSNVFPYPACTWWADQRYYQLHRYFVPWRTNAMAWQWTARAHQFRWNVSARPSPGSIVNMQPWVQGAYGSGHVAVVERVLRGGTVIASSMSWGANPYAVVYIQVRPGAGITFISR
ncbi:MAG: LysM peptidoglycan-binding domain-containing protein [Ktedonobacteraceae bacterium]|nr:LysM peptidoglycan-binding domain-containing protein [Ktedonobacteraceae bacterium]